MRHDRAAAIEAFWRLIDTDDALLATEPVVRLLVSVGNEEPTATSPVVERMLASPNAKVREVGGQLAAFVAMSGAPATIWRLSWWLRCPRAQGRRRHVAHRLPSAANGEVAATTLATMVNDSDHEVRKEAAGVAGALRGHPLRPFEAVVNALIASPAFSDALSQLLITLERAPDRVDDLALLCAQRFVEVFRTEAGDLRTAAAGDARRWLADHPGACPDSDTPRPCCPIRHSG